MKKTIVLAPEYDQETRRALRSTLAGLNATRGSSNWALAGSQEIESLRVSIDGEELVIESETYIGLTITGCEPLIDRIAALVKARVRGA